VIHLSRANVFEHAVSGLRARRFGFHRRRGAVSSSERFEIDFETLVARMQEIEQSRLDEIRLLEGVPHLSLVYEEDLRDEARHQATLDRVCGALGLESGRAHSAFGKVSPNRLRDSISNYEEIERRLAATPWARFLEGP
jgi:LPS sulfotransferase NodH